MNDLEQSKERWHADQFGITKRDKTAYLAHRQSAKQRGIPFNFTLLGWVLWWRAELRKIGPEATRGTNRNQYVMARRGDLGAYEVGNVYCATPSQNMADIPADVMAVAIERIRATRAKNGSPLGSHLMVRGDGHPRSKAVITPLGRFGSIALASEAHGFTRQAGHYAVKRGTWLFE